MDNNNIFAELGLTADQTAILYNIQYLETDSDAQQESNSERKSLKFKWLDKWRASISDAYPRIADGAELAWLAMDELVARVQKQFEESPSKLWFHLAVLEAALFVPYYPLEMVEKGKKTVPSKEFSSIKDAQKNKRLEEFILQCGQNPAFVKRVCKTYGKITNRLNKLGERILISALITTGVTVATVITAGALAPALAPTIASLLGATFPGLSGAALTSASLAFLGGGAIAAGGAGMAGGTAVIVGGGAILGLGAGAVTGTAGVQTAKTLGAFGKPFAISQAAKLEVTLREVILNEQRDVRFAQEVLLNYKQKIMDLNESLTRMELEHEGTKKDISNLKKIVDVMKRSYQQSNRYTSSFELGLEFQDNEEDAT